MDHVQIKELSLTWQHVQQTRCVAEVLVPVVYCSMNNDNLLHNILLLVTGAKNSKTAADPK